MYTEMSLSIVWFVISSGLTLHVNIDKKRQAKHPHIYSLTHHHNLLAEIQLAHQKIKTSLDCI